MGAAVAGLAGRAERIFVENASNPAAPPARPAATVLAPGERRRTPESVLIAVEAAQQACTMARREARELPHVFASAYGDLAINDYLCATLARAPGEVSPTKFHNSVHNAPAGYWAIASDCMRASTSVSAGAASFGAGLLEAAVRVCVESEPVLLVAYDVAACRTAARHDRQPQRVRVGIRACAVVAGHHIPGTTASRRRSGHACAAAVAPAR